MLKKYTNLSNILKKLLFDHDMKPIDLARALHIPQPTIHRLVVGKSVRPYKSSLIPIANYFSISVEQLIGEKPLPQEHSLPIQTNGKLNSTRLIPLIPWKSAADLKIITPTKEESKLIAADVSEHAFTLIMPDSSMEPLFPRGTFLIFDPDFIPGDRGYVLVKHHENTFPIFRQLLIDMDHKYLKPLNPDLRLFKMRMLDKNDRILAGLIESRLNHRSEEIKEPTE